MSALIGIYYGSPTAGGTNGTRSSEGTEATPITVGPLDTASNEESSAIKLAVRCDNNYKTGTDSTITPTGANASKWALAPDNGGSAGTWGSYGAALTFASSIGDTNVIFWAKAKAASSESPSNDTSVDLVIDAEILPE